MKQWTGATIYDNFIESYLDSLELNSNSRGWIRLEYIKKTIQVIRCSALIYYKIQVKLLEWFSGFLLVPPNWTCVYFVLDFH